MNHRPDIDSRNIVLGQSAAPIPERLLLAHARGGVLFIAGAGVSMSAGLPDFRHLVIKVYEALDSAVHSVISATRSVLSHNGHRVDLPDLTDGQKAEIGRFQQGEYDVVLGMLERRLEGEANKESPVREKIGAILRAEAKPAPIHRALMRLADRGGATAIITTNFDLLLENAARNMKQSVQTYVLGGVPRPTRGREFSGVLHIHGALDRSPKRTSDLIISDHDFGEYYFRRRVAPDLIYDAARLYNLVLVGYSANDPPMRYLLNAVAADVTRFPDIKERFIFVGMGRDDPVALEDWRARRITPIRYESPDNDHSQLEHTLVQWAELSAINGRRSRVDREMKNIVKTKWAEVSDEKRDLFDHLVRRSETNERLRLSSLVSKQKADLGWLNAIVAVSQETWGGPLMLSLPHSWNARDQETIRATVAFLEGRLEEKETIEWAAGLGPGEVVKRRAILHLLDRQDGINFQEPWRSAWRLIEESWEEPIGWDDISEKYIVRDRLHAGDRSASLVSAIVDLVAPRLKVEPRPPRARQYRKFPKNPKTFHDMFSTSLKSGEVVDPSLLGLEQVTEGEFIISLANALDAAVAHGLDLAKRIGWEKREHHIRRVYYISECKSDEDQHDPDRFHRGTAPAIKFLYAVVSRLIDVDCPAALGFVSRWKQRDSQIHLRLWAAMSRDPRITPAAEVGEFLLHLGDEAFWDVSYYPEIAELRAWRFHELDGAAQKAITKKIRKGPSRRLWPKNVETSCVTKARLYWIVRELKRIQVAGAALPRHDTTWLESNIKLFHDLAEMDRIDEGFLDLPKTDFFVSPNPDHSLDSLVGIDRLKALEQALSRPSHGLDDEPASRARAWLNEKDNSLRVLKDMESSLNGGAEFPQVWECLGWIHSPAADQERVIGKEAVRRMLDLLETLSGDTLSKAIEGITHWLSSWQKYVVVQPNWSAVWLRAWPSAVETTNARQPPNEEPELNVSVWPDADEPRDLDTLNPPAGKLVGVFLAARPDLTRNPRPFDNPDLRAVRDHVINASGQSGLIAKHRLIELLGYFLRTDKEWTQEHLIRPLRADNGEALALWRAVSRRTQFKDVLEIIGDDMVVRTKDRQLGRNTRGSLAFSLVAESLHALREQREPAIEHDRIQQMIRSLDDEEVRTSCAEAVTRFVSEISSPINQGPNPPSREALFQSVAKPFLQKIWPQERSLTSPGLSRRLAKLPAIARGSFAEAVDTVERFLMPFACWSMSDYELYGNENGVPKLAIIDDEAKADALLRLLDRTVGTAQDAVIPYGLGDALAQVREVAPHLAQATTYRRLETAARRTRW